MKNKMVGKFDIISSENARKAALIIGVQFGIAGYIIRIGLYKEKC
jgi:hypothetical protein